MRFLAFLLLLVGAALVAVGWWTGWKPRWVAAGVLCIIGCVLVDPFQNPASGSRIIVYCVIALFVAAMVALERRDAHR